MDELKQIGDAVRAWPLFFAKWFAVSVIVAIAVSQFIAAGKGHQR